LIHAIVVFTRYASLLAAAMCTELFVLNCVQPTELFPTPSKHWPPAPFLLMFITSMADLLLYFFLVPETRGKKLPDHMPGDEPEKEDATGGKQEAAVIAVAQTPPNKNVHSINLNTKY
uniref:XK-related protein n=1 Tax=Gongylonema pulchrum TaxID=637853 RepID=A0A183E7Z4_9BILA